MNVSCCLQANSLNQNSLNFRIFKMIMCIYLTSFPSATWECRLDRVAVLGKDATHPRMYSHAPEAVKELQSKLFLGLTH